MKIIAALSFGVLLLTACSPSSDSASAANPPVDPQSSFEDFEVSLRNAVPRECKLDVKTTFEGESYKEYACDSSCSVDAAAATSTDDVNDQLAKIRQLAEKTSRADHQTRTRKNMAQAVITCIDSVVSTNSRARAAYLTSAEAYRTTRADLSKRCAVTEQSIVCPEETSAAEYATYLPVYLNFYLAASNWIGHSQALNDFSASRQRVHEKIYAAGVAHLTALNTRIDELCKFTTPLLEARFANSYGHDDVAGDWNTNTLSAKTSLTLDNLDELTQNAADLNLLCSRLNPVKLSIVEAKQSYGGDARLALYGGHPEQEITAGSDAATLRATLAAILPRDKFAPAYALINGDPSLDCAYITDEQCADAVQKAHNAGAKAAYKHLLFIGPKSNCTEGLSPSDSKVTTVAYDASEDEMLAQIQTCNH